MNGQRRTPRARGRLAIAVAIAVLALVPASATAMRTPGDLSPRLALLAQPAVRSAPPAIQAERLGLARQGPGSLLRWGDRVLARVRFGRGAVAGARALRARGARIVHASRRYQTVTVAVRPAGLRRLARAPRVAAVTEVLAPVASAECPSGEVVSEGVEQLHAGEETGEARDLFGVDGTGVTVGILSDSFDLATEAADGSGAVATTAADDVLSGDLPGAANPCGHTTSVDVLEEEDEEEAFEPPVDEGRGMAQIVHDVAPGAGISFASAFNGEDLFAANIGALADDGADVIVDDVFYFEEPFFQDGPVAVAATEAVEDGAAFFSAAGNSNIFDSEGHEIASWETPLYRDAEGCPPEVEVVTGPPGTHCLDFAPGSQVDRTFGVKVEPGGELIVDLQWNEPWYGVGTDLDAYLLDDEGGLVSISWADNLKSQRPFEALLWENETSSEQTVQLVVNRFDGAAPRLKLGLLGDVAAVEYPRSTGEDAVGPTIFGHSGAASAISVGAIRFNNSSEPEKYSSRGPVRHHFGPVTGSKAASQLGKPEILSKPDLIATDCGATTFFAGFTGSTWRFCGTSAAAPHAAGAAALMIEAEPGEAPSAIRSALQASAAPVGEFGPCAVGAGLVEAAGAVEELLSPGAFSPPECSPPSPEGSPEEARAPGDWGSETPTSSGPTPVPSGVPAAQLAQAPKTFFLRRPPRLIRTRHGAARAVFRFGSDQPGVSFVCRVDGGLFRTCPGQLARRFPIGWHTVRVFARDSAGNADRTPAVYRFRVKRIR